MTLKVIESRLAKAYALPTSEQKRWASKIEELEIQADQEAVKSLIGMNRIIASMFICKEEGKFTKFLMDNKKISNFLGDAEKGLNTAYQSKNWKQYLENLDKYAKSMLVVMNMFQDCETKGYRDILPEELDVNVYDLFSKSRNCESCKYGIDYGESVEYISCEKGRKKDVKKVSTCDKWEE